MSTSLDANELATDAVEYIFSLPQEMRNASNNRPGYQQTSGDKKKAQEDALWEEVGEKVYQVKADWVRELYCNLATDDQVAEYLKTSASGYDAETNRWEALPDTPADETELIPPLLQLANRIIAHFHPSFEPGVSRSALGSRNLWLLHDNGEHASHPDIFIKSAGPSFETPHSSERSGDLGYTNVAAVIDARTDATKGDRVEQAAQLAIYCR
ncbi:hypothetical protein FA13DRAFT_1799189 [Coprinellus micaceus]|uniref:Uncharacterized protein n=1 Tax=Coprinellus micaceus TaxID=71717 RepID=A0A4Y7SJL4_COPMI|nr:hypothetical protein FA13DRAFT_1799189 [Coprinellus micaceus]